MCGSFVYAVHFLSYASANKKKKKEEEERRRGKKKKKEEERRTKSKFHLGFS